MHINITYTVNNKRTLLKRMFIEAKINLNMSWTITCGPIEKYLVTSIRHCSLKKVLKTMLTLISHYIRWI